MIITVIALGASGVVAADEDEREYFQARFFSGYSLDTFAASELQDYLNPEASGDIQESAVAGVHFQGRIVGDQSARGRQLWIFGRTIYGVRSQDIDCQAQPTSPLCKSFTDTGAVSDRALAIVRNARTLEGFGGFRWEFHTFQAHTKYTSRLYVKAQAGFLTVSDGEGDAIDQHHVAVGIVMDRGLFRDSYFEVGVGKSDLYVDHTRRFKVDGYLVWGTKTMDALGIRPYFQTRVDADLGSGADSIQTFIGLDVNIQKLIGREPASP